MGQSSFTHPLKLVLNRAKPVLGIIIGPADEVQEPAMKLRRGGGNDFEIGEHSTVGQLLGNLTEQGALALVLHVMDGETGNDHIERSKRSQWVVQVPLSDADPVLAAESTAGMTKHGRR